MNVNSDLCAALNKRGYRLSIYGTASGYVLASVRTKETPRSNGHGSFAFRRKATSLPDGVSLVVVCLPQNQHVK